ncbi:tetratricopeptide repeat protein [bacterium]|nr:tetratricopeptide repeat protein [bacterium]
MRHRYFICISACALIATCSHVGGAAEELHISTRLKRIDILLKQGKTDEAEKECLEALRINPKLHGLKLTLARIFQARGDTEGAIKVLSDIIEQRKTHLEARLRRAEIYLGMQNYEKALEDADAVAKLDRGHPSAHFIRGAVFMQQKKLDEAIAEFRQAAAHPAMKKHFACHFWLARCLLVKGKLADAIGALNAAVEANPDFIPAYLILASTHLQEGSLDKAVEVILAAEKTAPESAEILHLLGWAYERRGDARRSKEYYRRSWELASAGVRGDRALALIAVRNGFHDKAIEHLSRAIERAPGDSELRMLLGSAYRNSRDLDAAKAQFEEVLKLRPRHPRAGLELVLIHRLQGRPDLAEKQCLQYVQEHPGLRAPRYRLVEIYEHQGKYKEAEAELDALLKLGEDAAKIRRLRERLRRRQESRK